MKIELLGHEAEVEWISAKQSMAPVSDETIDGIGVWFALKEPVCAVAGFGIEIPAREYTKDEFVNAVVAGGANALQHIINEYEKEKAARERKDEQRKRLNRLVGNLGERIDVMFHLDIK